jgi:hypothetical protein
MTNGDDGRPRRRGGTAGPRNERSESRIVIACAGSPALVAAYNVS